MAGLLAEKKAALIADLEKQQSLLRLAEMNIHRLAGALSLIAQLESEAGSAKAPVESKEIANE